MVIERNVTGLPGRVPRHNIPIELLPNLSVIEALAKNAANEIPQGV
jgi:hypothetical protein